MQRKIRLPTNAIHSFNQTLSIQQVEPDISGGLQLKATEQYNCNQAILFDVVSNLIIYKYKNLYMYKNTFIKFKWKIEHEIIEFLMG